MKYFKNIHLPNAYYKMAGGKSLIIPSNVRWNTILGCIEANLNNWHVFMRVYEENCNIKQEIIADVQNFEIKRQAWNINHFLSLFPHHLTICKGLKPLFQILSLYGKIQVRN